VSGSAAEEPIALAGRDEGVCLPVLLTSGRLDIVVGVEKNGRGSLGSGDRSDHGRIAVRTVRLFGGEDLDFEAETFRQGRNSLGAGSDPGGIEARPGNGGNGHEVREIVQDLIE